MFPISDQRWWYLKTTTDCIWKSFLTRGRKLTFHNELRQGRDWTKCVAYTYSFTLRHEINKFLIFPVDVYRIVNVFHFNILVFPFQYFVSRQIRQQIDAYFIFRFNKFKKRLGFPNIDNSITRILDLSGIFNLTCSHSNMFICLKAIIIEVSSIKSCVTCHIS